MISPVRELIVQELDSLALDLKLRETEAMERGDLDQVQISAQAAEYVQTLASDIREWRKP